jgi:hypothetical protein
MDYFLVPPTFGNTIKVPISGNKFNIDELNIEFQKQFQKMPVDHERKQLMSTITKLELDEFDNTICLLYSNNESVYHRRFFEANIEEIVNFMLYYPSHLSIAFEKTEKIENIFKNLNINSRIKNKFYDIMYLKDKIVILTDNDNSKEKFKKWVLLKELKNTNTNVYVISKLLIKILDSSHCPEKLETDKYLLQTYLNNKFISKFLYQLNNDTIEFNKCYNDILETLPPKNATIVKDCFNQIIQQINNKVSKND